MAVCMNPFADKIICKERMEDGMEAREGKKEEQDVKKYKRAYNTNNTTQYIMDEDDVCVTAREREKTREKKVDEREGDEIEDE